MTRESQRDKELALVRMLVRGVPDIEGLDPTVVAGDPPDMRVGDDLGIEVVEFMRRVASGPQIAIEQLRRDVTERARVLYEGLGGPAVRVHVQQYLRELGRETEVWTADAPSRLRRAGSGV